MEALAEADLLPNSDRQMAHSGKVFSSPPATDTETPSAATAAATAISYASFDNAMRVTFSFVAAATDPEEAAELVPLAPRRERAQPVKPVRPMMQRSTARTTMTSESMASAYGGFAAGIWPTTDMGIARRCGLISATCTPWSWLHTSSLVAPVCASTLAMRRRDGGRTRARRGDGASAVAYGEVGYELKER